MPQSFARHTGTALAFLFIMIATGSASASSAPRMSSAPDGDFSAAVREITGGPWTMGQAWRETPEPGLRPGEVRFGWMPDALWIFADLPDDHVTSRSTDHSQLMWELGDVFEIFVAEPGAPLYLELHVTPNNHRLHMRWTERDFARVRTREATTSEFIAAPDAFASWVRRFPSGGGWQVLARVPATLWPDAGAFRPGQKLEVSFSRYDAGPEGTEPVLSSTSPHRKLSYHRRDEWRTVVLGAAADN